MRGNSNRASVETEWCVARAAEIARVGVAKDDVQGFSQRTLTRLPVRKDGDHISLLAHAMIPDRSIVMAGQRFVKIWALQNTGVVGWRDRKLQCVDREKVMARCVTRKGERVLVPDVPLGLIPEKHEVTIPRTLSGDSVEVSVTFRAPRSPCDVLSRWVIVDEDGERCFPEHSGLWCAVSVIGI